MKNLVIFRERDVNSLGCDIYNLDQLIAAANTVLECFDESNLCSRQVEQISQLHTLIDISKKQAASIYHTLDMLEVQPPEVILASK